MKHFLTGWHINDGMQCAVTRKQHLQHTRCAGSLNGDQNSSFLVQKKHHQSAIRIHTRRLGDHIFEELSITFPNYDTLFLRNRTAFGPAEYRT